MTETADNFDWMDEAPADGRVNNGRNQPKEYKKRGQRRLADGTLQSRSMTETKWRKAIELIASGVPTFEVPKKIKVTREIFNAYLITNVGAHRQIQDAKLLWLRRDWSLEDIDTILNEIAMGKTVKKACQEHGFSDKKIGSFYSLMRGDKIMRDWYDAAREIQAESWLDDTIDIADDRSADWYEDEKGNMRKNTEIVQRSKLRVDQRNWAMGTLNRKRFGDRKHIDLDANISVNHATILGSARKRLEQVQQKRGVTIEGEAERVENNRAGAQSK